MRLNSLAIGGVLVLACGGAASADVVYNINTVFSGTQASGFVRATFSQSGADVVLTLESFLGAGEFLDQVDFNYGSNTPNNYVALSTSPGTAVSGTFDLPIYSTGSNAFQADGDGQYDIQFDFSLAPPGTRFDGTDVFQITFLNATESEFFNLSNPAGGSGPFHTAGHIQGIAPNGSNSGWHRDGEGEVVPLPPPVYAGGGLLAAIGLMRIVRRRNA